MAEFDACKVEPKYPDAYKHGKEIGEQAAKDGQTGAAWTAVSQYVQDLFRQDANLPPDQKRTAWANQSRDAMNGMACGDPRDFAGSIKPYESDPRQRDQGDVRQRHPDVSGAINGAFAAVDQGTTREDGIARATAFVHNRVDPLGEEGRELFIQGFNARSAHHFDSDAGAPVIAVLSDDKKSVLIKKNPEGN